MLTADLRMEASRILDCWDKSTPVEESAYNWLGDSVVKRRDADPKTMTVVDLFCGAGGASYGFKSAGFNVVLGIDFHKPSMETFLYNHPNATGILGDISKVNKETVLELLGDKQVKCIIAGIPCQGFSLNNRKRNPNDPRNYLFWEFIRFAKMLNPDVLMLENVSGMKTTLNGSFVGEIEKQIKLAGVENGEDYNVAHRMLDAAEFGVPQKRRRLIFLAVKGGLRIYFPKPRFGDPENPFRNVRDAIGDLPSLKPGEEKDHYEALPQNEYQRKMREGSKRLSNHKAPNHPPGTVEKISSAKPGEPIYPKFTQRIRLTWGKPSPTQVAGGIRPQYQFGHPSDARGLTVRERARIQSFPDSFLFFGGTVQERVQTGNAVPPLMAKALAEQIKVMLNGEPNENSLPADLTSEMVLFE